MNAKRRDYEAYLLRVWRAKTLFGETWRASLEDAETHEVRGFRDLEGIVTFLKTVIAVRETDKEPK